MGVVVVRFSVLEQQPGSPVREAKTPLVKPRAEIEMIVANQAKAPLVHVPRAEIEMIVANPAG